MCVSLAIVAAACSDSATGVPSRTQAPTTASFAGNPPPPPLTGDFGFGQLEPFGDEVSFAATANAAPTNNTCEGLPGQDLFYSWDYLNNKTDNNQWAHLDIEGQNRKVSIHQTKNKLDASGEIVGDGYVFKITGVVSGFFDQFGYDLTIEGTVTQADGTKCRATAELSGSLAGSEASGN
jgi:hypothetical protein